ncbi:MAG TPA: YdeI/OmpD-associated family protein [Actinomycetota bacterium]|nr:YdeI/OmpD-associated family protein [Actinomycetota bacterium]
MSDGYEQVEVTARKQWREWLRSHHASSAGVWVTTYKKAAGERYVPYDDIAEEALAYGWIDSRRRSVDEERSQLLVTPRKPKSGWSRVNKERVERLEAAGLMTDAGREAIAVAKENGAWSALDDIENLVEPDDLRHALDADAQARRHWDAFPRSAKRATLDWIAAAKRDETRRRRVSETARLASQNVRANQLR